MVMVNGVYLTNQQAQFYNSLYSQGGDYRATAIRFLESRRASQPQQLQQPPVMGPVAPRIQQGQPSLMPTKEEYKYAQNPIGYWFEHTPLMQYFNQPKTQQPQPASTISAQKSNLTNISPDNLISKETQPQPGIDLKKLLAGPAPAIGSYQEKPGGPILIKTETENARISTERQINQIKDTPYKQQHGYIPPNTGYTKEIQSAGNELDQQKQYLSQVQSASEGTTFIINEKEYTQQEAINIINNSINQLTSSKAVLERYKEAGYVINKTDEGYSFSLPKASDVVRQVYGREPTDVYIASELRTLGFGVLFAGIQQGITGQKSLEAHKEETAESILGTTRKPGESSEAYTARFWNPIQNPEVFMDVYLPILTLGVSKGITTAGRVLAPELISTGSKLAGYGAKLTKFGGEIKNLLPESVRYVGFRAGFASKTALYDTGRVLSTPLFSSPIGRQAIKYGFYGAMEGPMLIETARTQPELLGARIGQSLTRYEVGMGTFEAGGRILQKGVAEMRQPIIAQQRPFAERYGLRSLGEEATQPLPGAKRFTTKGMTAEERFAFDYKPPKTRLTPEEAELESLSASMRKKGLKDFIKNEEGTMPLLPSIGPKGRSLLGNKRTFKDLLKGEETAQPLPGIRPVERTIIPRKEIFFSETTGKTEFIGGRVPRGMATTIEEFPRTGGLEIGEVVRPTSPLNLPASYEKEVTRVGAGKRRLDIIEAKRGPPGQLSMTESKLGKLEMIEFTPERTQYFEGLMRPARGSTTVSGKSIYGPGGPAESLETMPLTKEQAVKSWEKIYTSRDISKIPATQEEAIVRIQSYYGEPVKTEGTVALRIGAKTKLYTKEDIADFTGLSKPEPIIKQGNYALDYKAEENVFLKEITEGAPKTEGAVVAPKTKTYPVTIRGQTKVFTTDELMGLGKGELKERPQIYKKEQLQKAIYSPGGSAEYYGKQLRKTIRVKIDEPIPVGTRPQEGWGKFLGERQNAKIIIEKPKQYAIPELEKETVTPTVRGKPSTPLKYERTTAPTTESIIAKEVQPISTGKIGTINVTETKPLMERTSFKPTGLYESPDMRSVTVQRPLSREEVSILMGPGSETVRTSSRYWETIRPKIKEGARLLSRIKGKGLTVGAGGLIASLGINRERLQFASGLGGRLAGDELLIHQNQGVDNINKFDLEREQLPDVIRVPISSQGYDNILGLRQGEETRQDQRQGMLSLTAQKQEQATIQEQAQEEMQLQIQTPIIDTTYEPGFDGGGGGGDNRFIPPFIPRRKKQDEYEREYKKEKTSDKKAYDVYVKERGMYHGKVRKGFKFSKVNRKPLTETDALSLGGDITDNTSAVSFRLKKNNGRPERPDRSIKLFSERQHKFTKKGETYIEKPDYRMDTPGELQQVSALGHEERRNQRRKTRSILHPVKKTYNHGTGLLSPTNKIMETKMFRKKKGGKKNDYY